ncbi:2-dehydropantoate 2-reductase [Pseudobacillus sp. FSL P4-0506]|uniref:2-dehydropantoate 2-reductase n=1 Tax=unclassified Pseudobacillus TaxID=2619284 RepID=UPI0030FA8264
MKIGVVGGGAVGMFFAASLAEWFPVTLFTRTKEQADKVNQQGIIIEERGTASVHFVQGASIDELPECGLDCLVVAVKQYTLPSILPLLEKTGPYPALVFLQNGMSHIEMIKSLPQKQIYVAAVEHGILKSDLVRINVRGRGKTNIAVFRGDQQAVKGMTEQAKISFPFQWWEDYETMLLGKLAANTVINPLTAILRVPNGELISNPHYLKMAETVYQEFTAVFGKKLNEGAWDEIMHICRTTAANHSSMLKDIESKRPTEVDAILGYVLSQAEEKEIALPVSAALYHMIKGIAYGKKE